MLRIYEPLRISTVSQKINWPLPTFPLLLVNTRIIPASCACRGLGLRSLQRRQPLASADVVPVIGLKTETLQVWDIVSNFLRPRERSRAGLVTTTS